MSITGATTNLLTKAVGIAGLGLVAYDAHKNGKNYSNTVSKDMKATSLSKNYLEELALDSSSAVRQGIKKGIFHINMEENVTPFFTSIGGYAKGFGLMVVENVIPLGLALGATIKNPFSKLCGLGLLAYGAMYLAQEALGIGKSSE